MSSLEQRLCNYYHAKNCVFTGNGTTAMYLGFKALDMQERIVVFPAITCTNPVNSAKYAGYNVKFCDVNENDCTMDLIKLEEILKTQGKCIIVPTHIYGQMYDRVKIAKLAEKYDAIIMEDAAQTTTIRNANLSVVSFGHTKIFEVTNGGGAIFCDDDALYNRILEEKRRIKKKTSDFDEKFNSYCRDYYAIMNANVGEDEKMSDMRKLQESAKEIFLFNVDDNMEICHVLDNSKKIIAQRQNKARVYECLLDKSRIERTFSAEVPWRFSFLYGGNRQYLLESARAENIDISSWYPSVARIYAQQELENASKIEKKVVNLWVDEKHSEKKIEHDIEVLNEIMRGDSSNDY